MVTVSLFIIGSAAGLVALGWQLGRVREELARERASRREAVEEALAEGFRLGVSLHPVAPPCGEEFGEQVPAGTAGGAR